MTVPSSEHCPHPAAYIADGAAFDTQPDYQLMIGCVLCSAWSPCPLSWQTHGDAINIRQPPLQSITATQLQRWRDQ